MNRLRAYLQLMRFPAVFSVIADVLMAYFITHRGDHANILLLPLILLVSCSFYLAGMVFNDIFDRKIDAIERPGRPLPSGRVPLTSAIILGCSLLVLGLLVLSIFGLFSLQLGILLVLCILLYDGVFNKTSLGPLFMGGCRVLNLLMVASSHAEIATMKDLSGPVEMLSIAIGIYIAGLTLFARYESLSPEQMQQNKSRVRAVLGVAILIIFLGLLGIGFFTVRWFSTLKGFFVVAGLSGYVIVVANILYQLLMAIWSPSKELIQRAVKTMLQSIVLIDSFVIWLVTGEIVLALITLALLIPARYLGRWIYIT